jgi:hypothetical protein
MGALANVCFVVIQYASPSFEARPWQFFLFYQAVNVLTLACNLYLYKCLPKLYIFGCKSPSLQKPMRRRALLTLSRSSAQRSLVCRHHLRLSRFAARQGLVLLRLVQLQRPLWLAYGSRLLDFHGGTSHLICTPRRCGPPRGRSKLTSQGGLQDHSHRSRHLFHHSHHLRPRYVVLDHGLQRAT